MTLLLLAARRGAGAATGFNPGPGLLFVGETTTKTAAAATGTTRVATARASPLPHRASQPNPPAAAKKIEKARRKSEESETASVLTAAAPLMPEKTSPAEGAPLFRAAARPRCGSWRSAAAAWAAWAAARAAAAAAGPGGSGSHRLRHPPRPTYPPLGIAWCPRRPPAAPAARVATMGRPRASPSWRRHRPRRLGRGERPPGPCRPASAERFLRRKGAAAWSASAALEAAVAAATAAGVG